MNLQNRFKWRKPNNRNKIKKKKLPFMMTYPLIPIGLIAVFIVYILYLFFIKKDKKRMKDVLFIGLFFTAVWIGVYFFIIK